MSRVNNGIVLYAVQTVLSWTGIRSQWTVRSGVKCIESVI